MKFSFGLPVILLAATNVMVFHEVAVPLEPTQVNAIATKVTVRISGPEAGTGVLVEKKGNTYTVLTNWHVVDTKGTYTIQLENGGTYRIKSSQVQRLSGVDLAVFQFQSNQNYQPANIGNSDKVTEGTSVYAAGWITPSRICKKSRCYKFANGTINTILNPVEDGYGWVYSNQVRPGMSGGPVLDEEGKLVGINGRAITSPPFRDFLAIPINTYLKLKSNQESALGGDFGEIGIIQKIFNDSLVREPCSSSLSVKTGKKISLFRETPKEIVDEVWQIIHRQYFDRTFNQTDWQSVRRTYLNKSYKCKEEAYLQIQQMVKLLNNPHTRFITPEEFKKMQGNYEQQSAGDILIGVDDKTKKLNVQNFGIGSTKIIKIDGKSVEGINIKEAISLIKGKPGTYIKITIERNRKRQELLTKIVHSIRPLSDGSALVMLQLVLQQ